MKDAAQIERNDLKFISLWFDVAKLAGKSQILLPIFVKILPISQILA